MNRVLIVAAVLVLGVGAFLLFKNQGSSPQPPIQPSETTQQTTSVEEFVTPKKSAHFESNTPEHGSSLAGVPVNIVIDFNFDLSKGSNIEITKDSTTDSGQVNYGIGETIIDSGKLAMRRKMDPASPDGLYLVSYKACWADGSCHDGEFQFKIDKSLSKDFVDQVGKKEVTINLTNYAFSPAKVKVSKGTKVTWINQDNVVHTVNTDSHPGHSYYLDQNSRDLKKGESYSITFIDSGIYLYHCSPHAANMKASLLVE